MFKDIVSFIREVYGVEEEFIPLHAPVFNGNEKKYLNECIDSTFVSSVGKFVDLFEELTRNYTGSKYAVVTVNGTNALHLALSLAGVKIEHEVITQALTFIATANAIVYTGAQPIFIDVDKTTMGMSPDKLSEWLKINAFINREGRCINKNTKKIISACVPMHTFGHPCKIDDIVSICNEYNIKVIEDAAESLGSYFNGKHTGTFGDIGILSFNGNKTITTGGGGMIITNNQELAKKAKHLTTQAKVPHPWEYSHDHIGYNYRMPNINAAIGCAQIEQLPHFLESKRQIANNYSKFLSSQGINFFVEPNNSKSNYWLNAIILNNIEERNEFLKYTNDNNVMTRPIWKLMNKLPMFQSCLSDDLSNSEWFEDRVVNIPSSAIL